MVIKVGCITKKGGNEGRIQHPRLGPWNSGIPRMIASANANDDASVSANANDDVSIKMNVVDLLKSDCFQRKTYVAEDESC